MYVLVSPQVPAFAGWKAWGFVSPFLFPPKVGGLPQRSPGVHVVSFLACHCTLPHILTVSLVALRVHTHRAMMARARWRRRRSSARSGSARRRAARRSSTAAEHAPLEL